MGLRSRVLLVAVALVALVSCIPDPRGDVGISLSDGHFVVHLRPCAGDDTTRIRLVEPRGGVVEEGDPSLWLIARSAGSSSSAPADIVAGSDVVGFDQLTRFQALPSPDARLVLFVDTMEEEFALGFHPSELREGHVISEQNGLVPIADFESDALSDC